MSLSSLSVRKLLSVFWTALTLFSSPLVASNIDVSEITQTDVSEIAQTVDSNVKSRWRNQAQSEACQDATKVTEGNYEVRWHTIDNGGGRMMHGGGFELVGTVGQPDTGDVSQGGDYSLTGGFWSARAQPACSRDTAIFCDGFETGDLSHWSDVNTLLQKENAN